jgi:hypothetical protein
MKNHPLKKIKVKVAKALALMSLDFNKDFVLYTFAYDISFKVVLMQKDHEGNEYPIEFMSLGLQGEESDYPEVDKNPMQFINPSSTLYLT